MKSIKIFCKNLFSIFNLRSLLLCIAAVIGTHISIMMGWKADYPMVLIGTAVIFPIVFSLNGAYTRREEALKHYAEIKANLRSLYIALTKWHGDAGKNQKYEFAKVVAQPLFSMRGLLTGLRENSSKNEPIVFEDFEALAKCLEKRCREKSFQGGEVGSAYNFLNSAMSEFEKLKHIYEYRTPRSLQAFSDVFITVLPLLYGPVFANLEDDISNKFFLYIVPALFAFILSSLDNIQAHLEDPFDGIGVDDLVIRAEKFKTSLTKESSFVSA